ncbi:MAG: hypothetical protein ACOZAO_03640 [Patescibacteria group bacterium]
MTQVTDEISITLRSAKEREQRLSQIPVLTNAFREKFLKACRCLEQDPRSLTVIAVAQELTEVYKLMGNILAPALLKFPVIECLVKEEEKVPAIKALLTAYLQHEFSRK